MSYSLQLLVFALLSATVGAQIGLHCLKCYSGVCNANSTQLADLFTPNLDCCSCFGLNPTSCANASTAVMVVEQRYSSLPQTECCSNVSNIVTTESYELLVENNPSSCDPTNVPTYFHSEDEIEADSGSTDLIGSGSYIVTHFQFPCEGCIESLLFQVQNESEFSVDNDILEFTIYHGYSNGDVSNLYEARSSFTVSLQHTQVNNLFSATPLIASTSASASVCFESGNVLGFTINSRSHLSIIGRTGISDRNIHNITDFDSETDCTQLDGLIETIPGPPDVKNIDPLLAVKLVPLAATSAPSPTATNSLLLTPSPTPDHTNGESDMTTTQQSSNGQTLLLPLTAIIAIGVCGCFCLVLLFVIILVAIFLIRKRYCKTVVVNPHKRNGIGRVVSTNRSPRMEDLRTSGPDVITVVNKDADAENEYDLPAEIMQQGLHFYHELDGDRPTVTRLHNSLSGESCKYMTMNPVENPDMFHNRVAATGQHLPNITQGDPEAYHDPKELANEDSHSVPNPLYRTGLEANEDMSFYNPPSHYDVPTALMRTQQETPPPFYHVLEGPAKQRNEASTGNPDTNIYTETGFGFGHDDSSHDSIFGSQYSLRSTSVDTTAEAPFSPNTPSTTSESALLPHFYHELENTIPQVKTTPVINVEVGEGMVTDRHTALRQDSANRGLEGSLHRVFEPGIYVPGGEERQHLAVVKGDDSVEAYQTWKQKSYKAGGKKKQFFEESIQFWEPKNAEQEIYNQLSERKFREILRDQIEFSSHLGVGQFGSVSKATWSNMFGGFTKVAVKTLKPTMVQDAKVAFLKEAAIMGQFCHSNVIQLYGVVTVGEPIMIVMELMALGDLDTYLWKNYRPGERAPPHKNTLLSFSRQVACGMKYLARKNFIHRDLAARNVLVTETLVCKIGDFGMSRYLKDTNYYASKGGTVPIKWTAPEGLNYKKFSTASDVYSYGMVLYEIWSLGLKPLAHIQIKNVSQFVTEGNCQHPPPGCPRKIYEIMVQCWSPQQSNRPTFVDIFETLSGSDTELLRWSENDLATLSNLAMQLGAPLDEAKGMFLDLQRKNIVKEEILPSGYQGHLRTDV